VIVALNYNVAASLQTTITAAAAAATFGFCIIGLDYSGLGQVPMGDAKKNF